MIGADGQMRLMETYAALNMARHENLDLVEVSMKDGLPLCKLIDYGKHKYELTKKQSENKKRQTQHALKEIRLTPRIEQHDIDIKINQVKKFLEENHKVQVSVSFKGRENSHKELGFKVLEAFKLEGVTIIGPKSEGNSIYMILQKVTT